MTAPPPCPPGCDVEVPHVVDELAHFEATGELYDGLVPGHVPDLPAELAAARDACRAARWPELHRDDCAWCAHVAAAARA